MKAFTLPAVIVLIAALFVSFGVSQATASDDSVIVIKKWGRNFEEAETKAEIAAEKYMPYEVVKTEQGWDPNHAPHSHQYYFKLTLQPILPGF